MQKTFQGEPMVQFAAATKGDYDMLAYMLSENSFNAEEILWRIMADSLLSKYDAKCYMVPFGQIYSFVPMRTEFIEKVLARRQWHRRRFIVITPTQEDILKREFLLLKELNENAAVDFSEIDNKYGLGRGASRYTYQQLKAEGIIARPTITMSGLPLRYIGILQTETLNPGEVNKNKNKLRIEELEYGPITNKYALIGNTSIPEGVVFFIPIIRDEDLEDATTRLASIKGTITRSMIISKILSGSLCYRRFDNMHSVQYPSLLREKKVEPQEAIEYEENVPQNK
jgi:DNA-binding Lrp family transcriptional regulator